MEELVGLGEAEFGPNPRAWSITAGDQLRLELDDAIGPVRDDCDAIVVFGDLGNSVVLTDVRACLPGQFGEVAIQSDAVDDVRGDLLFVNG